MKNLSDSNINPVGMPLMSSLMASISVLLFLLAFHSTGYSQTFIEHSVDQDFPGICKVKIFDLDMDGDYDIIGGSEHTPWTTSVGIAWWRNDGGYPIQWTKFQVSSTFLHVMSVDAGLIDNDSLPDLVTSSWENGKISWWKNSGDPTQNWTEQILVSGLLHAHDAVLSDLNSNGKNEIIGVSSGNNRISIFYNISDSIPVWDEEILTNTFYSAKSVSVADLNNDSEPDIIGSADVADDIIWWDNNGGDWDANYITTYFNGSARTDIVDVNYDDQLDVIGTGWQGNEVSYWICDDINQNNWTKTVVSNNLSSAASALGTDLDMDGDIDIVAVGKSPGKLVIFYNDNFSFTETALNLDFYGGAALAVVDIDGDGDEDIISGAGVNGDLFLYENTIITDVADLEIPNNSVKVYPNPFSKSTTIKFEVKDHSKVLLIIYDHIGKEVKTLFEGYQSPGKKNIVWDGKDMSGNQTPGGIYTILISTGNQMIKKKLIKL